MRTEGQCSKKSRAWQRQRVTCNKANTNKSTHTLSLWLSMQGLNKTCKCAVRSKPNPEYPESCSCDSAVRVSGCHNRLPPQNVEHFGLILVGVCIAQHHSRKHGRQQNKAIQMHTKRRQSGRENPYTHVFFWQVLLLTCRDTCLRLPCTISFN